jgi:hypothetical protein
MTLQLVKLLHRYFRPHSERLSSVSIANSRVSVSGRRRRGMDGPALCERRMQFCEHRLSSTTRPLKQNSVTETVLGRFVLGVLATYSDAGEQAGAREQLSDAADARGGRATSGGHSCAAERDTTATRRAYGQPRKKA